jgi:ADP-heptose:LPS heptosyltransferase
VTTSDVFVREMVLKNPQQFQVLTPRHTVDCVPPERWSDVPLEGKRLLFLLPSQALGSNVATVLALAALLEHRRPAKLAVFCAKSAADIYDTFRKIEVFPYWLDLRVAARYDYTFDLGQIEGRQDIEVWPIDMEGEILRAFGVPPASAFPAGSAPVPRRQLRLGILPLGSSPLRTLPVAVTAAVAERLHSFGDVTVYLNRYQLQGRLCRQGLEARQLPDIRIVDGLDTIGDLMKSIRALDYAVFADSGPAHMAKLFATPGFAIYTSAPGDILQGRFHNLAQWQVPFVGAHCAAPCGLAKLRLDEKGRIGCMGSLETTLETLPKVAGAPNAAAVTNLFEAPVPCVAHLAAMAANVADAVAADLEGRRE